MTKVIIYSTKTCRNCKLLKKLFVKENIKYEEVDMVTPKSLTDLVEKGVFTTSAPVLQIDENFFTTKELCDQDDLDCKKVFKILKTMKILT